MQSRRMIIRDFIKKSFANMFFLIFEAVQYMSCGLDVVCTNIIVTVSLEIG